MTRPKNPAPDQVASGGERARGALCPADQAPDALRSFARLLARQTAREILLEQGSSIVATPNPS
jgi:hypothetical protein